MLTNSFGFLEESSHSPTADLVAPAHSSANLAQEARLIPFPFCGIILGVLCEQHTPACMGGTPEYTMASSPHLGWVGLRVRRLVGLAFGQLDQGF